MTTVRDIIERRASANFATIPTPGELAIPKPAGRIRVSLLDRSLVRVHSEYTRLKMADPSGIVRCFTCHTPVHWKFAQEGHFIPRRHTQTKFLNENTNPQCPECNVVKQGNLGVYKHRLNQYYGDGTAEYLLFLKKNGAPMKRVGYIREIAYYKTLVKIEKKRIGLIP